MKLTKRRLRKIIQESFRSLRTILRESTEISEIFHSTLESFIYNYLTFFVERDFKHTLHFYQSVHKFTEKYADGFFNYLKDSPVFEDVIDMMKISGISTYKDQMIWIKQYFVENWESIMAKIGGMR